MAYSQSLKALEKRVADLRRKFLPVRFSKTGLYTADQLDFARAYRVLVHAEIESYLEERVLELAQQSFDLWKSKNVATPTLAACLTNVIGEHNGLPSKLGTNINSVTIAGKILSQFKHTVNYNNGIRIENILSLMLPVGAHENQLDTVWLSTIDGFGSKRGKTAHSKAVSYTINPQDDFNTIRQIMEGLKDIDIILNGIRRKIK